MGKIYTKCLNCGEHYDAGKLYCPNCNTSTAENKRMQNGGVNGSANLINCPTCGKNISSNAKSCPNCGEPIDTTIKCPKCGSANTRPISNNSKIGSMIMWGVFSANKVLNKNECLNCKHKF